MHIQRTQEEAHLILSRREALLTASMGAMTVALGACSNNAEKPAEEPEAEPEATPSEPEVAVGGVTIDFIYKGDSTDSIGKEVFAFIFSF